MATSTDQQPVATATASARDQSPELAVGVPVLQRTEKLRRCLMTMPACVDRVIVADNGHTDDRRNLYAEPWSFTLDVLDLPYDAGIGACRQAIAAASEAPYLVVADCDMAIPRSVTRLVEVLDADDNLGAVAGMLDEYGDVRAGSTNLHSDFLGRDREALVHDVRHGVAFEDVAGHQIARFDKLPNAMVVRQACLDDYAWDSDLKDKEHLDWFVHHWRRTDWEFATCTSVLFDHEPTREGAYAEEFRHGNDDRQQRYRERFLEKWAYDRVVWGPDACWYTTADEPLAERLYRPVGRHLPTRYAVPLKDLGERLLAVMQ